MRVDVRVDASPSYSFSFRTHESCVPTFEVIEIELLDNLSNNSIFGNQRTNFTYSKGFSIGTANILKDVEKSYDKGKFLLEESKKSDAWDAIFRRF